MFENIKIIKQNDPAAKSYLEIILCYPGLHALWFHKVAHFLYKLKVPILPRFINTLSRFITGLDIHPGAKIANGIMIDHGMGVVIGETAVVGKGCIIYQGVTLGGTGKESGKRHPTLKENIVIGSGAKVLGNITIGNNVRIGSGSIVIKDVPDNCTVVGLPGYIVKAPSAKPDKEHMLDHASLPNPVAKVFAVLIEKVEKLEKQLNAVSPSNNVIDPSISENLQSDEKLLDDFVHGAGI